jgi:hypothetical protein
LFKRSDPIRRTVTWVAKSPGLIALATALAAGCAPRPQAFTRAEVRQLRVASNAPPIATKVVEGAQLDQLVSYFPGVGTGRRSELFGSWMPTYEICFFRADSTRACISTNGQFWNEESGDWRVDPAFIGFARDLFAPATSETISDGFNRTH